MVQSYKLHFLRFFLFFLILIFFSALQSSTIFQTINPNIFPQLGFIFIAYLSIYQNPILAICMIYLTALFYSTLTFYSFAQILILNSMIFIFAQVGDKLNLKNRSVFFLFCSLLVLFLPILNWIITPLTVDNQVRYFSIVDLLITSFLTFISSVFLHFLFLRLESWIQSVGVFIERNR